MFALLLDTHKIDENTVGSMKGWRHSGFSVDTSVRIEGGDQAGMSRLVGYISRSPLSLARMVARTADGKVVYRGSHPQCWPFPKSGEQTVMEGFPWPTETVFRWCCSVDCSVIAVAASVDGTALQREKGDQVSLKIHERYLLMQV